MQNFISVSDVDAIEKWLQLAVELKNDPFAYRHLGKDKTLGLLFLNPSLRTRLSTRKAAYNLGMHVMVLNVSSDGWAIELEDGTVMNEGTQEHIKEAAGVLSQYCDVLGIRTFASLTDREQDYSEAILKKFVHNASVPVLSLESATLHPLQSFADLITIKEHSMVERPKVVLSWAPHPKALPQAVANSFVEWMRRADVELVIANPEGYDLSPSYTDGIPIYHDQETAFNNADFIYAKNWSSYENYGQTIGDMDHWTISEDTMKVTNQGKFMHCLPVRRNVVVTDQVIDSPSSLVLEQANNRTYAAQVALMKLLGHGN